MKSVSIFNTLTGEITSNLTCQSEVLVRQVPNDRDYIEGEYPYEIYYIDVIGRMAVKKRNKPSENHVFNYTTKQWEDPRTLQDFKAAQWSQIKKSRSQAEYAGFIWDGSGFDSDAVSQNRITGAVTLAQMSPDFSIDWVLADNTTRTLTQLEILQVGAALGQHIAAQFSKGVALRSLIETATTQTEVESVVW